jgi:uroporphyrinogen-III synthase
VAPYRTVPAQPTAGAQLAALSADAVLFASGSAVRAWVAVFGTATPPLTVAIGPQTAAAAAALDLKVDLVAADHSLSGMVAALEEHLSAQD